MSMKGSLSVSRERKTGGAVRGKGNTRNQRIQRPYTARNRASRTSSDSTESALKFLLPKVSHAGCFIGAGGQSINELMEVTGANVHISSISDVYPGTNDRVVYVTGTLDAVSEAQAMTWDMIGRVALAAEGEQAVWSPKTNMDSVDDTAVEGKITIPATAAGSIIGRGGSTIQTIIEESGAQVTISNLNSEPPNTNERVVTISGTVTSCASATNFILAKLAEDPETAQYVTRGTKYPMADTRAPRARPSSERVTASKAEAITGVLSATTTINVAVPNSQIGNILGKQGATLKEIVSLSGAEVAISNKGEYIEGTTNRLVTISGAPAAAQTAHTLISNILSTLK